MSENQQTGPKITLIPAPKGLISAGENLMRRKKEEESAGKLMKDIRRILETPLWIPDLETQIAYSRLHDDHDGTFMGRISVSFTPDGDAWVDVDQKPLRSLRFRTDFGGGGLSPRVRNALIVLAYAIKLDNEERPHERPPENSSQ